jgi:hypothetical protein
LSGGPSIREGNPAGKFSDATQISTMGIAI